MPENASAAAWGYGEGDALQDIAQWMVNRPGWQQQAMHWMLQSEELKENQLEELFELALNQKPASDPVRPGDMRIAASSNRTVVLRSIDEASHVNALAAGQRLTFGERGLTVIYGRNGTGKSGYARILKHACRARLPNRSAILPNIADPEPGTPSARITFSVNSAVRKERWSQGEASHEALSAISVFDSATAPIHVDEVNEVAYTPYPLVLLERLANVCTILKQSASAKQKTIEAQTPELLRNHSVPYQTEVGKLLDSLGPRTKEEDVRKLAKMADDERARLASLRRDLAGDPRQTAQQLRTTRANLLTVKRDLANMSAVFNAERLEALTQAYRQSMAAREAAKAAATRGFGKEPLPGIGDPAWYQLWEAARKYAEEAAYPDREFPAIGAEDRCVLCQQHLSEEAAARLNRFEAFVRDETETHAKDSQLRYRELVGEISKSFVKPAEIRRTRAVIVQMGHGETGRMVSRCLVQLSWNIRRLSRGVHDVLPAFVSVEHTNIDKALDRLTMDLEARATALTSAADSKERQKLIAEVNELAAREWLCTAVEDVVAEIGRKRILTRIQRVDKECATNPITKKATELTERLVTDKLRSQFQQEIGRLGVHYAGVELQRQPSKTGMSRFQVKFTRRQDSPPIGQVLSEGEFRTVALAAFLAELATAGGQSAIIFDDPVSSLDNEHREDVAKRLVEVSQTRQVIVFTHDLAFLILLHHVCVEQRADPPQYRTISRGTDQIGMCLSEAPNNARAIEDVFRSIESDLDKRRFRFDNGDEHEWRIAVRSYQDQLRECWERAVEEFVSPVTRRFSHKVDTQGLEKLTRLTEQACEEMRNGYGRCSKLLHSSPVTINPKLPTPDKILAEIHEVRLWHKKWCQNR